MRDCGPHCEEALREIQAFLDGELDPSARSEVEHHLTDCNPCMQRVEFRRHLKLMVSSKCGGDAVPTHVDLKIRELIRTLDVPPPL
jgi:mycothiol system anti-sigma-R factor